MQLGSYREVPKVLTALGFEVKRKTKTSHEIWYKKGYGNITLSKHKGESIKLSTLRQSLRNANISWDDFKAKYSEVIS